MSKHTPGPWKAECHDLVNVEVWNHNSKVASITKKTIPGTGSAAENALLIAAAPDMLYVLKRFDQASEDGSLDKYDWKALSAAIAKAEGAK